LCNQDNGDCNHQIEDITPYETLWKY
jgi:hypothetical protein